MKIVQCLLLIVLILFVTSCRIVEKTTEIIFHPEWAPLFHTTWTPVQISPYLFSEETDIYGVQTGLFPISGRFIGISCPLIGGSSTPHDWSAGIAINPLFGMALGDFYGVKYSMIDISFWFRGGLTRGISITPVGISVATQGLHFALVSCASATQGVSCALWNYDVGWNCDGIQTGVINISERNESSKFQIGLLNAVLDTSDQKKSTFQIGLINYNPESWIKISPLFNISI